MKSQWSAGAVAVAAGLLVSACGGMAMSGAQTPAAVSRIDAPRPAIIPAPASLTPAASGVFVLASGASIVVPAGDADAKKAADHIADLIQRTRGLTLSVREGDARPGDVTFARSQDVEDAYGLAVTPDGARITAGSFGGFLYGGVSLWQLATQTTEGPAPIAALTIQDAPRFGWRGVMLDSARHYQSVEFIKQFIDWMSLHKLNKFHWHLTDDQAWRMEIKAYPRLTEIGGWRVDAGAGPRADIDPATGKPRLTGGIYTQDQMRDVVAYAAARNITVVPEIDLPGHASAAVHAYPELGVTDVPGTAVPAVPGDWGIYVTLFNTSDETFRFLENVLDETMAIFPSRFIHLGGDEAVKDEWKKSPAVQARMRELGITDENTMQIWFMTQLSNYLKEHSREMIGWDEILEGGQVPDATVMSWRGVDGAVQAARLGHDTILAPAPMMYLNNIQSPNDGSPGRGDLATMQGVYDFNPTPDGMTEEQSRHVLGVQANLWVEHLRTEESVVYMFYPRIAALSELAWTPASGRNWQDFVGRLAPQFIRYDRLGIGYAHNALDQMKLPPPPQGQRRYDHQMRSCNNSVPLNVFDDAAGPDGVRATFSMDLFNPCWMYDAADLSSGGQLQISVGQVPFNWQILHDIEHVQVRKPATPYGELEIRVDSCEGAPVAVVNLEAASRNNATTVVNATLPAQAGRHNLCLMFTQPGIDPTWVLDWVLVAPAA